MHNWPFFFDDAQFLKYFFCNSSGFLKKFALSARIKISAPKKKGNNATNKTKKNPSNRVTSL